MSGRGRGRGGFKPPTGAQLFLKRSAEEAGLDSRNLRSLQDITRPSLFPDIMLHSSGQSLEEVAAAADSDAAPVPSPSSSVRMVSLIKKGREMHHRMQNSVFYVRCSKEVPDVVRFSDARTRPPSRDASAVFSHCLGGRTRTSAGQYVPDELVTGKQQQEQRAARRRRLGSNGGIDSHNPMAPPVLTLAELEAQEKKTTPVDPDADNDDLSIQDDEEEEEGEDYVMNHYESEGDEDGGGDDDGEPTF